MRFFFNNRDKYDAILIGRSTNLKGEYETISLVRKEIRYEEHQWVICIDLKMINFLLGQQNGNIKYPCFFFFMSLG